MSAPAAPGMTAPADTHLLILIGCISVWQVDMYGFMAIGQFSLFSTVIAVPLEVPTPEFWFMQIAVLAGFVTAYPVTGGF